MNKIAEYMAKNAFYRLPDKIVHTNVYRFKHNINSFCDKLLHGDDYDKKEAMALIKTLQDIDKEAKEFKTKEEATAAGY
jgi:hypothetical protein